MYKRLAVFGEHLARLGNALGGGVDAFNKAVGSLEQQVLPAARRFPELGLRVNRVLEPLEPIEALTRAPRVSGTTASESTADGTAAESP
jgi:DNA recombination protein RmuC